MKSAEKNHERVRIGPLDLSADLIDLASVARRTRYTGGMAPTAAVLAWTDWALHLAYSPGKRLALWQDALRMQREFLQYSLTAALPHPAAECVEPAEQDRRFADAAWHRWPFNLIQQAFLMQEKWWDLATTGVRGVSPHHEDMVNFAGRQWLDMISPANYIVTNPEVQQLTMQSAGMNLVQGAMNAWDDARRALTDEAPAGTEGFEVGRDVAVTPGKVVFSNRLIELIQYAPATSKVQAEPVLIVPSWIMKYYILDLSPHNSLVSYLVSRGHTVFIISWKNPDAGDRDLGMHDYRELGVMAALDAVTGIVPDRKVQAVGYCLGGTLLSIAAAAMARDGDERLQSLSLLASETDFRESGEIKLFVDESQLAWLEAGMWRKGYLEGWQMAGSFQMLNSQDLIWSRRVREYLMGDRRPLIDLMAWNADTTRMPYRMHSEYLRHIVMNNDLAEGRYLVDGRPVAVSDIRVPMFVVGTLRDHVAPWRSVYKIHLLNDSEITFALTSGGHNAGIVSEPGRPRRHHQINTRPAGGNYVDPDRWLETAASHDGSWWPSWDAWLKRQASDTAVAPPAMGGKDRKKVVMADAPGSYVMQR
ncbi:MAG: alpha/beta fold hydrolase [Castellaniella sp.]